MRIFTLSMWHHECVVRHRPTTGQQNRKSNRWEGKKPQRYFEETGYKELSLKAVYNLNKWESSEVSAVYHCFFFIIFSKYPFQECATHRWKCFSPESKLKVEYLRKITLYFVRIWSFNSCVNSLYHPGEVWSNSNGKHSIYDLVYLIHLNDYWLYLRSRWLNVCWDLFNVSYGVGLNKSLRLSNKLCQYWIHHSVRRLHERIALFFEMKWRNSFWFLCFGCLKTNYCSLTSVTVKIP